MKLLSFLLLFWKFKSYYRCRFVICDSVGMVA